MFTVFYSIVTYDFCSNHSSTHDERIIGLFQTFQEAKEVALRMAKSIFDKAYKAALENIPDHEVIDQNLLPSMYEGEVGVSVDYDLDYLTSEASQYHADSIAHHFKIKEIEPVF